MERGEGIGTIPGAHPLPQVTAQQASKVQRRTAVLLGTAEGRVRVLGPAQGLQESLQHLLKKPQDCQHPRERRRCRLHTPAHPSGECARPSTLLLVPTPSCQPRVRGCVLITCHSRAPTLPQKDTSMEGARLEAF